MGTLGTSPLLAVLVVNVLRSTVVVVSVWLLLAGCASGPVDQDSGPTPRDVVRDGAAAGPVHWGGRIVRTENLSDRTRIEVVAFPLDASGRPQTDAAAGGRFVIEKRGFLEPQEYAANRLIEVDGQLRGFLDGKVGDAAYRYPLVAADRLVLWPGVPGYSAGERRPTVNFGIGAGSYGSGVGIGIGF